jgi:hypothetical protein
MAKVNLWDTVMANVATSTGSLVKSASEKPLPIKATELPKLGTAFGVNVRKLNEMAEAKASFDEAFGLSKVQIQESNRTYLCRAISNLGKASLDRTEEGIEAFRLATEGARRTMFEIDFAGDIEAEVKRCDTATKKLPEYKAATAADKKKMLGKVPVKSKLQLARGIDKNTKESIWKYASWTVTARAWNVSTQLLGEIDKYGFSEIFDGTDAVPYQETQKWSLTEDATIEKVLSEKQGSKEVNPMTQLEQTFVTLKKRLEAIDLTTEKGDGDLFLNKTMMMLTEVKLAQVAAKKAEAKKIKAEAKK